MKRFVLLLLGVCLAAIGLAIPAQAQNVITGHDITYTRNLHATVLEVHGYPAQPTSSCPGSSNVAGEWAGLDSVLTTESYAGAVVPVEYSCADSAPTGTTVADIRAYGPYAPIALLTPDSNGNNTKIETFSWELAWYTYYAYTNHSSTVSFVTHSMGGLIVRYMLDQIVAGNPDYPPTLYVQDIATVSAPFEGISTAYTTGDPALCGSPVVYQCQEMQAGSTFVTNLIAAGTPQATLGSDWTAIGGALCDFVPAASSLDNAYAHIVDYYTGLPCYDHNSYLGDTSTAADRAVAYYDYPGPYATYTASGEHSMMQVYKALTSSSW